MLTNPQLITALNCSSIRFPNMFFRVNNQLKEHFNSFQILNICCRTLYIVNTHYSYHYKHPYEVCVFHNLFRVSICHLETSSFFRKENKTQWNSNSTTQRMQKLENLLTFKFQNARFVKLIWKNVKPRNL